jgi:hypothetical protein
MIFPFFVFLLRYACGIKSVHTRKHTARRERGGLLEMSLSTFSLFEVFWIDQKPPRLRLPWVLFFQVVITSLFFLASELFFPFPLEDIDF